MMMFICFFKGMYPKITKNPVVSVINKISDRLKFKCEVDVQEKEENVSHEITWFQGNAGTEIKKDIISWPTTETHLQNNNSFNEPALFHLGQMVRTKRIRLLTKISFFIKKHHKKLNGKSNRCCE